MHYQRVNELLTDKTYLNNSSLSGLVLMEYMQKRFVRQQFSSREELCTKERMVFELTLWNVHVGTEMGNVST